MVPNASCELLFFTCILWHICVSVMCYAAYPVKVLSGSLWISIKHGFRGCLFDSLSALVVGLGFPSYHHRLHCFFCLSFGAVTLRPHD